MNICMFFDTNSKVHLKLNCDASFILLDVKKLNI